ncbi:MAG TPA: FMN-binding protein [Baekduia sp.]|uniref:FMN-binding protein n=1 Tax=Baekduia sp. TaxID=2600305 RepID=UPI002D7792AE|nr:FMN-binding protein [Baekduia sp.]HET6506106.1 FMN-binding protein [Baekduia sp.]
MPRRAPIVIAGTVAGLAAVLSFKPHESGVSKAVASASTPATSDGHDTFTGSAIATRYGTAQVEVTVVNGKITNIVAVALPDDEPKSVAISTQAEPTLKQEALTKQTAAIDAVTGATITSAGYEASLQSALDRAGFTAADGARGSSTIPNVEKHGDHGGFDGDDGAPPGFAPPRG